MAKRYRGSEIHPPASGECVVFCGDRLLFRGQIEDAVRAAKQTIDATPAHELERVALFDDVTGQPLDIDVRGTVQQVVDRLAHHPLLGPALSRRAAEQKPQKRGRGRPRLGVVSREVSLLPRHWRWLAGQGGASATLRRLVERARKESRTKDRVRQCRDAANRFMWEAAADRPLLNFEQTSRALYRDELGRIAELTDAWPGDIRAHMLRLVERLRRAIEDAADSA